MESFKDTIIKLINEDLDKLEEKSLTKIYKFIRREISEIPEKIEL